MARLPKIKQIQQSIETAELIKKTNMISTTPTLSSIDIRTPIGRISIRSCHSGLHDIRFVDDMMPINQSQSTDQKVEIVDKTHVDCADDISLIVAVNWMNNYFERRLDQLQQLPTFCSHNHKRNNHTDSMGTFKQRCWQTLTTTVNFGSTISYGKLAEIMPNSLSGKAARAVGSAMRTNPYPLIVPCHRVVRSDGTIGNYSGGRRNNIKKWLLDFETTKQAVID